MKKYSYKMLYRPFGLGCQPDGHIDYEDKFKSKDGCWGIITYDRKLTDDELYRFELKEVITNE